MNIDKLTIDELKFIEARAIANIEKSTAYLKDNPDASLPYRYGAMRAKLMGHIILLDVRHRIKKLENPDANIEYPFEILVFRATFEATFEAEGTPKEHSFPSGGIVSPKIGGADTEEGEFIINPKQAKK